jgi:hypothetical protein
MSEELDREIADLLKIQGELEGRIFNKSLTETERTAAVYAECEVSKKMRRLTRLRAKQLAGEEVSRDEIDEALGRRAATPKRHVWTDDALDRQFEDIIGVFDAVKGYFERSIELRDDEINKLKASAFEDAGVWKSDRPYRRNHGVTYAGSFWIAQRATACGEKPGDGGDGWRLAVKRGSSAK